MAITHAFSSGKADGGDASLVKPSNWNANHTVDLSDYTGWMHWAGQKRVTSQFDKSADTTLANVTGLSITVVSGKTYYFEALLFVSNDVGGSKLAMSGTCTATAIVYDILAAPQSIPSGNNRQLALDGVISFNSNGIHQIQAIAGTITVNAGGTLTVQFAQFSASGTSSVLVGSTFIVQEIA